MKKIIKAAAIPTAIILAIVAAFIIRDRIKFRTVDWTEGNVARWEEEFPDDPAYEMAVNSVNGETVFKDPFAAMKQFKIDYADLIEQEKEKYDLNNFTRYTYWKYRITDDPPYIIESFCYTFGNSFK